MNRRAEPPYVVLTAWHCAPCEVQGRSPEGEAACWNCGGPVTVTARPVLRLDESDSSGTALTEGPAFLPVRYIPTQRTAADSSDR